MTRETVSFVCNGQRGADMLRALVPYWHPTWRDMHYVAFVLGDSFNATSASLRAILPHCTTVHPEDVLTAYHATGDTLIGNIDCYKGNMLILNPWYCLFVLDYDKVLCIEEDFLLNCDTRYIFDNTCKMQSHIGVGTSTDYFSLGYTAQRRVDEWLRLGGYTTKDYYRAFYYSHALGSPRYFTKDTFGLQRFLSVARGYNASTYFAEEISKSKSWHCHNTDEWFNAIVHHADTWTNVSRDVAMVLCKPDKLTEQQARLWANKPIVHITGKHSIELFEMLKPYIRRQL